MTRNEEIIEALKYFYLMGAVDGVCGTLSFNFDYKFDKRFKDFWENRGGSNIFPNMEIKFDEPTEIYGKNN